MASFKWKWRCRLQLQNFASLSYGWIERSWSFCWHLSPGTPDRWGLQICWRWLWKSERLWISESGFGMWTWDSVRRCFSHQVLLCLQSLPSRTRQPKPVRRLEVWSEPNCFLQLTKNTFKNPGCTGRGDACHCQGVFFFFFETCWPQTASVGGFFVWRPFLTNRETFWESDNAAVRIHDCGRVTVLPYERVMQERTGAAAALAKSKASQRYNGKTLRRSLIIWCSIHFIYFNLPLVFSIYESPPKSPHNFSLPIIIFIITVKPSFQAGEALNFATSTRAGVSSSMAVLGGTLGTTAGGICGALAGGAAGVVPRYILGRLGGHFCEMPVWGWGLGGWELVSLVKLLSSENGWFDDWWINDLWWMIDLVHVRLSH